MPSRAETTRDQWATALATITVANGYNNTVKAVSKAFPIAEDQLTQFPHIAIELGDSTLTFADSVRTINDEFITLHVAGYVKADTETSHVATAAKMQDAMESLVFDLKKKICADLLTVNHNDADNPWLVTLRDKVLRFNRVGMLGTQRNIGMITVDFSIKLKNQSSGFGYVGIQDESGALILDEAGDGIEIGG